jgi:glucosylceramidase
MTFGRARRHLAALACLPLAAAVAACGAQVQAATARRPAAAPARAPARAAARTAVSVWETTASQSQLLARQAGAVFRPGTSRAAQVITVDPGTADQTMTGFGASVTDSSAWLIAGSPRRASIMSALFDPRNGIGLDFLRQPVGASDFARSLYSYDDQAPGHQDPGLADFSIAHDQRYVLPVLRQALRLDPGTTVMATPWSPPGWMKTSGSMIGGTLAPADYPVYARYLVRYLQAYRAAGVPVALLSPQNEPGFSPANYPGSTLTAAQEAALIARDLGPDIAAAGLPTKILAYDHNWDDPAYPEQILADPAAARYVAGVAWHCYAGEPSAQAAVHAAHPAVATYLTECTGTQSADPAATFGDTLDWQTANLIIGATRDWASSVTTWNLALDPSGGPSMNCTTCTALVTVDNAAGTARYNAEYYVLGQASKFVRPGAVRIASGTFGPGRIQDVAFRNRDGSTALIVLNSAPGPQAFGVSQQGSSFTYSLPSGAVATFTW